MEHIIDAQNKTIGRVATQAAMALMGKTNTGFAKNVVADVKVVITNASKTNIPAAKLLGKTYRHYSGHPGGLKEQTLEKIIKTKGMAEVYRKAVLGMLPKNKLQSQMIKNLKVTD